MQMALAVVAHQFGWHREPHEKNSQPKTQVQKTILGHASRLYTFPEVPQ
jgi:hypothetical protein